MSTLSNFAEQFNSRVLRKVYQDAVFSAITNTDYQGEIKRPGDRVNILSFPNDGLLSDYTVGTDMPSETIVDLEEQLVVEKRKSYNFSLDRLEDVFTYGGDIPEALIENYSQVLSRTIDSYVCEKATDAKAGNWVGVNLVVVGSGQTMASIVTTATGGTVTLNANNNTYESQIGSTENPIDGNIYFAGFQTVDLGKGFRLRSTASFVSPWYRISAITSSTVADITEWDGAVSGSDFEEGMTLRGLFGGDGVNFTKYGSGDASLLTMSSLGWEFQAAAATSVSSSSIYNQVTLLAKYLDEGETPAENRHLVATPEIVTQLKQASQLQPTGIAELYLGTVVRGRVMRVGSFDVHMATGSRVSTRAGKSTSTSGPSADITLTTGTIAWQIPAIHTSAITFAEKWSESRVVDAENQFAKKYQGLFLFGARMPQIRRRNAAILFGSV